MEMKLMDRPAKYDIVLLFVLEISPGPEEAIIPVCFHLHFGTGIHRSRRILHRPEKDILCAAVLPLKSAEFTAGRSVLPLS